MIFSIQFNWRRAARVSSWCAHSLRCPFVHILYFVLFVPFCGKSFHPGFWPLATRKNPATESRAGTGGQPNFSTVTSIGANSRRSLRAV
jgi:hypothetical protein